MYEKTSKLSPKVVHKKKSKNKKRNPDYAQGFVALKDCNSKKYYLHDLFDCWEDYNTSAGDFEQPPSDGHTMTRKTRPRQPRIHSAALQTGYCAICHLHYNSLEEHIQSKKHLKLIGDDANFISLNGFLDQDSSLGNFIDFNGISLDLDEKAIDCDYPPKPKRSKMPRKRGVSVSRKLRPTPPSPTRSESSHHLRSRKQINYASPSPMIVEEDSLPEKPEKEVTRKRRRHINSSNSNSTIEEDSSIERPEKDARELRSNNRIVAKLTYNESEDVWTSGRPKRSCMRPKRISPNESLSDKSYYKVEVVSPKLKSTASNQKDAETGRKCSRSPAGSDPKEKGLIVKFKKLRNSELVQLNNEAENFLFPKKDDSSSDEGDDDGTNTTISTEKNDNSSIASEFEDPKIKIEDDASMDSSSSELRRRRRRRTHAEAFILDNQKYYKFETPGSRLRYQGSFLPVFSKIRSPNHNGEYSIKTEKYDTETEDDESQYESDERPSTFNVDDYVFSFERTPKEEPWYQTFQRQDYADEKYVYFNDEAFWNPFILPYQMGPLPPIDPRVCISQYEQVKKYLLDPPSSSTSGGTTPDPSTSTAMVPSSVPEEGDQKEAKGDAADGTVSSSTAEQKKRNPRKVSPGKNPRKSPRQHASTLAILSSLIHQRKRKAKTANVASSKTSLTPIPEEQGAKNDEADCINLENTIETEELVKTEVNSCNAGEDHTVDLAPGQSQPKEEETPLKLKRKPGRRPRIDYKAIAKTIDEELTNSFDPMLDDIQLDTSDDDVIFNGKTNVMDVLNTYEEYKLSEDCKGGNKKFFNGVPGKKPGRKKKTNKTGWPNRIRRLMRKEQQTKDDPHDNNSNDNSTTDSLSVRADSEDNDICDDTNTTDSINKSNVDTIVNINSENKIDDKDSLQTVDTVQSVDNCDSGRVKVKCETVEKVVAEQKSVRRVLMSRLRANNKSASKDIPLFQPYVRVQKLAREQISNQLSKKKCSGSPKRTNRHQRRMPASPKSPRMLRKPRGRWYKER